MMKTLFYVLIILTSLFLTSCAANLEADAKQSAQYYCERKKIEATLEGKSESEKINDPNYKKASELVDKMNDIRKKYYGKENWKEFDAAFEKYKAECK